MKTKDIAARLGSASNFDRLISSDLGRRYLAEADARAQELDRKSGESYASGPHTRVASRRAESEAAALVAQAQAEIPVVTKRDAAKLAVIASREEPGDSGLRKAAVILKKAWELDKDGAYTAADLSALRGKIAGEFPRSTVWALFDKAFPVLAAKDLNKPALNRIASQIKTQADYDRVIDENGLSGNDALSRKSRQYILAQVNESGDNDMGLDPDDQPQGEVPQGLWEGMKPDVSEVPVGEKSDWWKTLPQEQKQQYSDPMQQEGHDMHSQAPEMPAPMPQQAQPSFQAPPPAAPMEQAGQAPEGGEGPCDVCGQPLTPEDWAKDYDGTCSKCVETPPTGDEFLPGMPSGVRVSRKQIRQAMSLLRRGQAAPETPAFEPDVNDQQDDALSVSDGGKVAQSTEPPQSLGSPEKPSEPEFKQTVPPNHQTDALAQPGTSASETSLKAKRVRAQQMGECVACADAGQSTPAVGMYQLGPEPGNPQSFGGSVPLCAGCAQMVDGGQSQEAQAPMGGMPPMQPQVEGEPQQAQVETDQAPDAELGEGVEQLVEDHMKEHAPQELAEGHEPWAGMGQDAGGPGSGPRPKSPADHNYGDKADAYDSNKAPSTGGPASRPKSPADHNYGDKADEYDPNVRVSRRKVEDLLLDGKVVQASGFAIRIAERNGKDQVEMAGGKLPPMAWPLRRFSQAVEFFSAAVEKHGGMEPGEIHAQQPDAVKPEKLGEDSSSREMEHKNPKINQQQPDQLSPDDSMPSNEGEGFSDPALRPPQPANPKQPGTSLPSTDLGQHSSDGEGFSSPALEPASKKGGLEKWAEHKGTRARPDRDNIRDALKGGFRR